MRAPVRLDLYARVGQPLDARFALRAHDSFREPVGVSLAGGQAFLRLFSASGLSPELFVGVSSGVENRCLVLDVEHSEIRLAAPASMVDGWRFDRAWYELWGQWPGQTNRLLAVGKLSRRNA